MWSWLAVARNFSRYFLNQLLRQDRLFWGGKDMHTFEAALCRSFIYLLYHRSFDVYDFTKK